MERLVDALKNATRRYWWLIVLAAVAALLARGLGATVLSAMREDATWSRIQNDRLLRVGMDASYPPFENVDEAGTFTGYDVDLARALGDRWDVDVRFVNVHFDGLYDALWKEKFDLIISALPYDRTLTRDLAYSQSYLSDGQVIVSRGDNWVDAVNQLSGRAVAVELGSEGHQILRQLNRDEAASIEILPERELSLAADRVLEGAADALICDRVSALELRGKDPSLVIGREALTADPYVVAARIDAPVLMGAVNEALEQWRADGTLDALGERWFSAGD